MCQSRHEQVMEALWVEKHGGELQLCQHFGWYLFSHSSLRWGWSSHSILGGTYFPTTFWVVFIFPQHFGWYLFSQSILGGIYFPTVFWVPAMRMKLVELLLGALPVDSRFGSGRLEGRADVCCCLGLCGSSSNSEGQRIDEFMFVWVLVFL